MDRIGRRVRATINPVSTGFTRWWCQSALRHMLTGYGPTAGQRRLRRRRMAEGGGRAPSSQGRAPSAREMEARAAAIDELLAHGDLEKPPWRRE